jgi:hypothetical protein
MPRSPRPWPEEDGWGACNGSLPRKKSNNLSTYGAWSAKYNWRSTQTRSLGASRWMGSIPRAPPMKCSSTDPMLITNGKESRQPRHKTNANSSFGSSFKISYGRADRLSKHGSQANTICCMCHTHAEAALHMMALCPFSKSIWQGLQTWLGPACEPPQHKATGGWRHGGAGWSRHDHARLRSRQRRLSTRCGTSVRQWQQASCRTSSDKTSTSGSYEPKSKGGIQK